MNKHILVLFVLFAILSTALCQKYRSAAECVATQTRCSWILSRKSKHCRPFIYVARQPEKCRHNACLYCSWGQNWTIMSFCRSWAIRHWCFNGKDNPENPGIGDSNSNPSMPQPTPPPKITKIVLCLARIQPKSFWTRNRDGLIWRADKDDEIDHHQGLGEICLNFKAPKNDSYYVTAITSAPRTTENNDLWIKLNAGLRLYDFRDDAFRTQNTGYFKGYQNIGNNARNDVLFSVDRDPHAFVSKRLEESKTYTLCFSGRSSRFTVYKFVLVSCHGNLCSPYSKHIRYAMDGEKDSSC